MDLSPDIEPDQDPSPGPEIQNLIWIKHASVDILRSKFEVYNFATKHDLSEAAIDELLQMLSNVGNMAILFTIVFVWTFPLAGWQSISVPS